MDNFDRASWIAELQADAALERRDMAEREQRRLAGEVDPLERWDRLRRAYEEPAKPAAVSPAPPPARAVVRKAMIDEKLLGALADETGANVREAVSGLRQDLEGRLGAVEAENADLRARLRSLEEALISKAVQSADALALPAPPRGNSRDAH